MFDVIGRTIFTLQLGEHRGKSLDVVVNSKDAQVESFLQNLETGDFELEGTFKMKLTNSDELLTVSLNEEALWKHIYVSRDMYNALGREACLMLDIAYNKGGSEAIVESYYGVMKTQYFDGGQNNDTLDKRTLVDWCLPPVLACPQSISGIAKLHQSRHRLPIFHDLKQRASDKYVFSKVLDRQLKTKKSLHFFN